MKNEPKQIQPVHVAPLVQEPTLIKVLTLSAKIVDQIEWTHEKFSWDNKEIVGRIAQSGLIVRNKTTGELFKVDNLVFLEPLIDQLRKEGRSYDQARDDAQTELHTIVQLFTV